MKLNKYFSTLLGGLLLFGTWACTDKIEPEPTPAYDGDDVYFSTTASADVDIKQNATEVSVNIYRVKADDALTVNISSSFTTENEEGQEVPVTDIFSAPASVTFAQGEKVVAIPVSVDFAKVEAGQEYYMHVTIEGNVTSVYGDAQKTFTLLYSQWSDWTWYDTPATLVQWAINGPVAEAGDAGQLSPADLEDSKDDDGDYYLLYYDGQIITRKSLINENLWMVGVGGPRYSNFNFDMIFTIDNSIKVDVNGNQYPMVTMETVNSHFVKDGEDIMISDSRTFLLDLNYTPGTAAWEERWVNWGLADSYYNPETGIIYFYPVYSTSKDLWKPSESYIYLPGFADYSLQFSYNGNFVNNAGVESAVINITRSDDVASYVYTLEYGALTDAQVTTVGEELAANTDLELTYDISKDVMFPVAEDGTYTIVAVMYDQKGISVGTTSFQFDFESVMKESKWTDMGMAYFTDDIMTSFFAAYGGDSYEVACEQYKEDPNIYRLVDPLVDWLENSNFDSPGTPGYIYFDITDPEAVVIMDSPLGLTCKAAFGTDEEIYLIDQAYGADYDVIKQLNAGGTLEDGVITFPSTFITGGKEYSLMLLTTMSLWEDGMAMATGENGMIEIVMPDSYFEQAEAVKAKHSKPHTSKANLQPKKVSLAQRGFISASKRKAAKAERLAADLKQFKESRKMSKF